MDVSVIVLVVMVTALAFDFTNGFHDTANAMATSIATGALRPRWARWCGTSRPGCSACRPVPRTRCSAAYLAYTITRRSAGSTRTRGFRSGQVASASLGSLAHGTNDAQKTMGVITLTLITSGALPADARPPPWVVVSAGTAIALGTYLGGRRIIRTMGKGITDIESPQGVSTETSAAAVVLTSSQLGFALSTTHVRSGGVIGAGVGKRLAEVRWGGAGGMAVALTVGVGTVGLFSLGIVALDRRTTALADRRPAAAATATPALCFAACAAVVAYGIHPVVAD
jgi:PiT family inorganic phosphate transporter